MPQPAVKITHNDPRHDPRADVVLTEAFVKAAEWLGVSKAQRARLLGCSPASVSRMPAAKRVSARGKDGELAALFLRVYRSLFSLLGGNLDQCRAWLHSDNTDLAAKPIDLVQDVSGLVRVADYLDHQRGI